ncbi:LysR family transcriptional regulator ArgP [Dyella sp. ASV21]|uniref:LysR family transcriptional regulator ArgP n=1 Tax=Dyella sp. ASV21 TaxID=2795114 RepID=UPI0018ECDF84|nr:LysR family transcriptional regulator ArgP [Dyella sp. ASV21]
MSLLNPQLAAFAAVLDEGSFELAAQRLSLTPSAISQRIKALEDRLGQVLILRRAPCRATPAGERLLRSVQQMRRLEAETLADFHVAGNDEAPDSVAVAVNADSLATWLLPALAPLHQKHGLLFDVRVDDQDHTTDLLRDGSVLGAITAEARPVQGCSVKKLGIMRYLPVAPPAFVARHFSQGVNAGTLATAPMLVFNRKDALQWRFIHSVTRARLSPPMHYLPSSTAFVEGAALGLGWAMAPESMVKEAFAEGTLKAIAPNRWLDVPLYWQHWAIRSSTLVTVTDALVRAATHGLRQSR